MLQWYFLDFIAHTTFKNIPGPVISQAKRCVLDWVGVTIGGRSHPSSSILIDFVEELGGKEQATLFGTSLSDMKETFGPAS